PGKVEPVYPRWRGEHVLIQALRRSSIGLSPLARGTQKLNCPATRCVRFIPAGAGNTKNRTALERRYTVYPRWRGEHLNRSCTSDGLAGLSPLARGTHSPGSGPA